MGDREELHQTIYRHVYRCIGDRIVDDDFLTGELWKATDAAAAEISAHAQGRAPSASTLYVERSAVRSLLIGVSDEDVHITEGILMEVDALPIFTAEDITSLRAPVAGADAGAVEVDIKVLAAAFGVSDTEARRATEMIGTLYRIPATPTAAENAAPPVASANAVRKALEFYADRSNWAPAEWKDDTFTDCAIPMKRDEGRSCDCGDTARAALRAPEAADPGAVAFCKWLTGFLSVEDELTSFDAETIRAELRALSIPSTDGKGGAS